MQITEDWLKQAKKDPKHVKRIGGADHEWSGFSARQAAEKSVKALFQAFRVELKKVLCVSVLVLLMIFSLTNALRFNASAAPGLPVHNIDAGLDYATIQEAINADATLDGHMIHVDAGTYYEHVVVNKSVSLVGENKFKTIVDGRASRTVILVVAKNVHVTGFTVRNSSAGYSGIHIYNSSGNNVSHNIIKNNYHGIYLYGSSGNVVTGNDVLSNEYGVRLYGSSNNTLTGNNASNNMNGIHLDVSSNNTLAGNNVSLNSWNGIYLYGSSDNILSCNVVSSNYGRGIRLHGSSDNFVTRNDVSSNEYGVHLYGSSNNTFIGNNVFSNNEYGIHFYGSNNNAITGNVVQNNTGGIWLIDSGNNTFIGNNVSSNNEYGISLWNSSHNMIFHNNFINNLINNVEQPSSTCFSNSWDNGVDGNFWGDYEGSDMNMDGIGDTPHPVDERLWLGVHSQDNYPLMGQFLQFSIAMENQSYTVDIVTNSRISRFQYHHDPDDKINAVSFKVNGTEGRGFCRISIPHTLIEPPYTVTVDDDPPLYNDTVRTNGTHTWLYFTYLHSEHEVMIVYTPIMPLEPLIWSQWWFWGILGLALAAVSLASFNIKYRRMVTEQKKVIQAYSPFEIARALFKADVERRRVKIGEFEEKYGVRIRPHSTLEDVIRILESREKEEEKS